MCLLVGDCIILEFFVFLFNDIHHYVIAVHVLYSINGTLFYLHLSSHLCAMLAT